MKKSGISDEECIARLQATVDGLAKAGASIYDIVTAFVDVAVDRAANDPDYAHAQLEIVADVFAVGQGLARLRKEHLARPKPRKKK